MVRYIILLTVILLFQVQADQPSVINNWNLERIDQGRTFSNSTDRSIILDNNKQPHTVYGQDHLYHTWYNGTIWQTETVDESWGVGEFASLSVDKNNFLHISYYDRKNGNLKYTNNVSGTWQIEIIDDNTNVGQYTSITTDINNNIHISYYDVENADLKYDTNKSGTWVYETVDASGGISRGKYSSLAVDNDGYAYISYAYKSVNNSALSDALRHASNSSGSWVIDTVDTDHSPGGYTSIVIDANKKSHISYSTGIALRYATNILGGWGTSLVDDIVSNTPTTIALDANGKVHIAYHQRYNNTVVNHATNKTGTWVKETIQTCAPNVSSTLAASIVIDDVSGDLHIAYVASLYSTEYLYYAKKSSDTWHYETVDTSIEVGRYPSIAMDNNHKKHISYFDETEHALKYATNTSGVWIKEIIDNNGSVGQYTSLAIDSNAKVHIAYYDMDNRNIKYITNTSGIWVTDIVNALDNYCLDISLALDMSGNVHISYVKAYSGIYYATNTSGNWAVEIVDSLNSSMGSTSIAIDSNGFAHNSYKDPFTGDFKYATNTQGSWLNMQVDTSYSSLGNYSSIALDRNNKVYIAYDKAGHLNYITNKTGLWISEIVDNNISVGDYTSLSIDEADNLHISYYDRENIALKYAVKMTNDWYIETVDNSKDVIGYRRTSIVAKNNIVSIAYFDETNGDLKYAEKHYSRDNAICPAIIMYLLN